MGSGSDVPPTKESGRIATAEVWMPAPWNEAQVKKAVSWIQSLEAERDALREALEAIARLGVAFDAKGTRSKRVNEIARAVLERTP